MTIVSFRHRFIFIKTTKTAGTSIEADLSRHLEPEAIVTPIIPAIAGHDPRNFADADGQPLYYNHMPASAVRERLGKNTYEGFLTFCVEREPVEKCISHFHMQRNSSVHNPEGAYTHSWTDYVEDGKFPVDVGKYTEPHSGGRRLIVDRILRYDRLSKSLSTLLEDRGLPNFRLTSQAKSEYSRNRLVSPSDVTAPERKRIYDAFRQTIELTGIDWNS